MIGYSDASYTSSLCTPGSPPQGSSPLMTGTHDKRGVTIQLTPLWEHVVKTQTVPQNVDLEEIFVALNDRLRDPEWEVRQHALRVLVDIIPVMDDTLDQKMEILLGDLVGNLGHPGPAVRKGALDSLKVYLIHSNHANSILKNIVFRGIDKYAENKLQSDVVVGIILSLPALLVPGKINNDIIEYVVKTLINKLVQVTFQEVSLRSLSRIRECIGSEEFYKILEETQPNTRKDFELLCQVYDTHSHKINLNNFEANFVEEETSKWNDMNANIIQDNTWNSDTDSGGILSQDENIKNNAGDADNDVPSGKVILETEIQFNSSTAVTMKILEERDSKSMNDSDSDEDNRDCVVKVLSDSDHEETFELRRRTPRRVRFGGEIVKLRTPDSDSNHPSDTDNDITITTTANSDPNNPVIEIKFITDENKTVKRSQQNKSLIPIPVIPVTHKPKAKSLPASPNRKTNRTKSRLVYQSHPNLTRAHFFYKKIPKIKPSSNKLKVEIPKKQSTIVDNSTSPNKTHHEVELFHNLTRSPTHLKSEPKNDNLKDNKKEPYLSNISSDYNKFKPKPTNTDTAKMLPNISTASNTEVSFTTDISDNDSNMGKTYSSFVLKDSASDGIQSDTYIPTVDTGDCLTCTSSGSEGKQTENNWETAGIIDQNIIDAMQDKIDWRNRLRGFETLREEMKKAESIQRMQPNLNSFLHFLFTAERHPKLQNTVEEILKTILSNSSAESVNRCLPQLALSLSKIGAPVGVRLGLILMQKLSPKIVIQHILEDSIILSRSVKTREGSLQLLVAAASTFPSTEFDVTTLATRVALVGADRKRRVRQAALDALAILAQLGQPSSVMDAVTIAVRDLPDKDNLLTAVRARLSRRQLPFLEPDGTVIYASPGVGQGADVDWVAAGSGSISPCSARSRRRVMTPATTAASHAQIRGESAIVPTRNMWSARRFQNDTEHFAAPMQHSENMTWALVPVENKNEIQQNKTYHGQQLWTVDQNVHGDVRTNESGSLRPVYFVQAQQSSPVVHLRQIIPDNSSERRPVNSGTYSRGRSSSPPVRLAQIRGVRRPSRGQSSSPPEFGNRNEQAVRRRFTADVSSESSISTKQSSPQTNWRREFQSAIPVPVSGEIGRARFRRRPQDRDTDRNLPMVALPHHNYSNTVTSAPTIHHHPYTNGRTKSPSPTRFSADKFTTNASHNSGINHHTSSSGSESSDYYTPPAEPYLPLQSTEPIVNNRNPRDDSFDQSDRTDTPPEPQPPNRERFINLEDSASSSDFDEQEEKKTNDSPDETDFVRSQIYQKLQEEHINSVRENASEKRLSKSHADLSEVKKTTRKTINSAPLVKHARGIENSLLNENKLNNNGLEEISKSSLNSSINNQSQDDLGNLTQSNLDLQSLNQSEGELMSIQNSYENLRNDTQSQTDLRNSNQNQLNNQNITDNQTAFHMQQEEKILKYPEIVRKKSLTNPKSELKRRVSKISTKVPAVFPDTLRSFPKPREGLSEMIVLLESPEWEQSMRGLQNLVRLVRHHPETVESQLHTVCVLLGRHIKNLRSQVARAACSAASEMFNTHRKALEMDVEELAVPLLHRTADTNKFLRSDANAALDALSTNLSAVRTVTVLGTRGATHQNAIVRCTTARLLADLVLRLNASRVYQLPRDIRDKILVIGANMLMEGSLETRKHAKNMFMELSNHSQFQRAMTEAVPTSTMRHISKILNNLK